MSPVPPDQGLLFTSHPKFILFGLTVLTGSILTTTVLGGFAAALSPRTEPSLFNWPFTSQLAAFGLTCTVIGSGFLFATTFTGLLTKTTLVTAGHALLIVTIARAYKWRQPALPPVDHFNSNH